MFVFKVIAKQWVRRGSVVVAALWVAWSPGRAHGLSLSLAEAIKRAETSSPFMVVAAAERDVSRARQVGADVLLPANPMFFFNLFGQSADAGRSFQPVYQFHLEQQFEIAGQRGLRQDEAAAHQRTAHAAYDLARAELRSRVIGAYTALHVAERRVQIGKEQHQLSQRIVEIVRTRQQVGAANAVDLALTEADAGRVSSDLIEDEANAKLWSSQLAQLVGMPETTALETEKIQRPALPSEPIEALQERASRHRREIATLEASGKEFDATLLRLHREVIPNPTLWFEFMREPALMWVSGGLSIQLPVWKRNQGDIAAAEQQKLRVEAELGALQHRVRHEVSRAVTKLQAIDRQLELFDHTVVPQTEQMAELVSQGWQAGKYDLQRVVLAKHESQNAKQQRLELLLVYWMTWVELQRSLGQDGDRT